MTHSTAKIGKKALSVLLALTLVLALAVPAMAAEDGSVTEDGITITLKNVIGKITMQIAGNQSIGYGVDGYGIEVKEPMTVDVYVVKTIPVYEDGEAEGENEFEYVEFSVSNLSHEDNFYSRVLIETYSKTYIDMEIYEEVVSEDGYVKSWAVNSAAECLPEMGETEDLTAEFYTGSGELCAISAGGAIIFFTEFMVEEPTGWAAEEINAARGAGLVPKDRQYGYKETINRLEVAGMFYNLLEKASGKPIEALKEYSTDDNSAANAGSIGGHFTPFTDTDSYVVGWLHELGIINGVGGGKFDPDGTFTRAQVIAILNRVAKLLGVDVDGYTHSFKDTAGHWVDGELGWAVANGIVKGDDNGNFNPDAPVLYEEAIAFTVRALDVLKAE